MKSENKYIGDDKFKKFLDHYSCPAPLDMVKMRFAGAICSPNLELRPTDVISSLWEDGKAPRLETKNEADLFFKFFMGLWDEMFSEVSLQKLEMPKINRKDNLIEVCEQRYSIVEDGFVEGFWGGKQNVKIPAYIAEVADNLTALAEAYKSMVSKINPQNDNENIFNAVISCDKLVIKSVNFLIENYVLPRMEELKRTVN
ncbi:MAG: hypothetical protein IJ564_03295 [Alphaproteobacteria bacterium]|nr:hypothetical protein [Alphaproteobacteria bacterium]MBR3662193.1 hypothetical protein [Alphaproteobacteria bacterium]